MFILCFFIVTFIWQYPEQVTLLNWLAYTMMQHIMWFFKAQCKKKKHMLFVHVFGPHSYFLNFWLLRFLLFFGTLAKFFMSILWDFKFCKISSNAYDVRYTTPLHYTEILLHRQSQSFLVGNYDECRVGLRWKSHEF